MSLLQWFMRNQVKLGWKKALEQKTENSAFIGACIVKRTIFFNEQERMGIVEQLKIRNSLNKIPRWYFVLTV